MTSSENTPPKKPPFDGLARFTFFLTLLVFVWPTHADMQFGLLAAKKPLNALLFSLGCYSLVLVPACLSFRRLLADKNLRGRGYLYATFVILLLNLPLVYWAFTALLKTYYQTR